MSFLLFVVVALASPNQPSFARVRTDDTVHLDVTFRDLEKNTVAVSFDLPAALVDIDRGEPAYLPRQQLNEASAKAVRAYGKTVPNVTITATVAKGGVLVQASGTGDVKAAMEQATVVREQAVDAWLAEHAFTRLKTGSLSFDHAKLAAEGAANVAPVAAALRAGTTSDRAFVARALAFVQAVPYEVRPKKGDDPGYRRPLEVLTRNLGDCDSKTVLFLAIVRAELPALPLAVVYVPGHVLAGVGLEKQPGEQTFRQQGQELLYVEPVGPAQLPLGEAPKAHRVSRGEARLIPG